VTGIVAELDSAPDVPVTVIVYPPSPVVDVVETVRVGPEPPSTGVPALTLAVFELSDTVGALLDGEMVAAILTVPVKPLRPVTLVGIVVDAGRPSTAVPPLVTAKLAGAVPGHVTRLVTCWLTAASPTAVRHGANSIWLVRLS